MTAQRRTTEIRIEAVPGDRYRRPAPPRRPFGSQLTNRMFSQRYVDGAWRDAAIGPLTPLELGLGASVLHYGQSVFEGLKAYGRDDGSVQLFRPERNARRLNRSARRMAMPEIDVELQLDALLTLVALEHEWIPRGEDESLYIRPIVIATGHSFQVTAGEEYLHAILLSPAGSYFSGGLRPLSILVEQELARAVPGGTGEAKTAGNYAASLLASARAKQQQHDDVLWLDAKERRYVEEVGSMNIAFVRRMRTIVTPRLTGSILAGITRESLLQLAGRRGYEVEETTLDVFELLDAIDRGEITEAFGMGTAAVVSPIGRLALGARTCRVGDGQVGPVARELRTALTDIQYGRAPDPFGWTERVEPAPRR